MNNDFLSVENFLNSLPNLPATKHLRLRLASRLGAEPNLGAVAGHALLLQSSMRAFQLIETGQKESQGRFSLAEMNSLLNANPSPDWGYHLFHIAQLYADEYGLSTEDLPLNKDPSQDELLRKLDELSLLGSLALIDFCETWWRTYPEVQRNNSGIVSQDLFRLMGLELVED